MQKLVARSITRFKIEGEFEVPRQTIFSRMKADRLEVWHTGETSPIILVEVTLNVYIICAWVVNCPLTVSRCIELMNNLVSGTRFERKLVAWKTERGMLNPNPEVPLLGWKWWRLYLGRNPEMATKAGRKFPRNRANHCHDTPFQRMFNETENRLVASGNARRLAVPVHMDIHGNIVIDVAMAFGCPVTIEYIRPENCFVMDETGTNTHGTDDFRNGGEKTVVPRGEVPREEVGITNSHFTCAPFNDFNGNMQCMTVILKGEKLHSR